MSIEDLAISLDEIFEKSQFYVALSRATNTKKLTLLSRRGDKDLETWFEKMISVDESVIGFYMDYKQPVVYKTLF